MNFFKLYIGDYQRDTGSLSITEHGAYMLMLQHFYATEKPLPMGRELYRLLRCETKVDRDAVDAVSAKFWIAESDGLVCGRAVKEIAKADHQRTVNQEVGKRGGRPKLTEPITESVTESVSTSEPNRNPNQTPDTRDKETPPLPPENPGGRFAPGFADFWQAYPRKVGKGAADKAWRRAKVNGHQAEVLQALEAQKRSKDWTKDGGQYVPNPATWINQRRWEDGEPAAEANRDWI